MSKNKFDVMIIDDDEDILALLNNYVNDACLEIDAVASIIDFRDPLDALQNLYQNRYDLIVIDIKMPRLDGVEVIRSLRENEGPNRNASVLMVSGNADKYYENMQKKFLDRKLLFIEKPFEYKKFYRNFLLALADK